MITSGWYLGQLQSCAIRAWHLVAQQVAGLHARQRIEVQVQVAAADGR